MLTLMLTIGKKTEVLPLIMDPCRKHRSDLRMEEQQDDLKQQVGAQGSEVSDVGSNKVC